MKGIGIAAASTAVMMLGGAGAFAADMNMPVKAVPISGPGTCTSIVDFFTTACQVAAYGIRFYGTVDIGASYQTHGTPLDPLPGPGLGYFPVKNSGARGSTFSLAPNGLSASNVGLQIRENIGGGWQFVGQVEAIFLPTSFDFGDNAGSVRENAGLTLAQQRLGADGGLNGTFYNQFGYAGFSHDTWGTLTFGRQNDLGKDMTVSYDPFGNAYGFSYIGFFGATAGGGDTEDAKTTTAVKYRVNIANWRLAAVVQTGGYDQGNASEGMYQAGFGADFHVGPGILAFDAIGGFTKDAVSLALGGPGTTTAWGAPVLSAAQSEAVTISNNTNAMVAAKYTWDRLKLYAGYEWIQFAPPSDDITSFTDESGNLTCAGCLVGGLPTGISTTTYNFGKKIQQTAWVGSRYSLTDSVDLVAAYYHADFSAFASSASGVPASCATNDASSPNCHGTADAVSFLVDYQFAPKWDTYIGTLYTKLSGSQTNGFVVDNNWATTAGVRFRW